jgi:RimJ/RimL family protein N-acetyltransferase
VRGGPGDEVGHSCGFGRPRDGIRSGLVWWHADDHPVHGIWAIATADGRLVGNLLLKPIPLSAGESSGPAEVEIGWHLHPDAWGQGYATEAAQAVLHDAFDRGPAKVLAVTDPDNHASQAVCRRLGMTALGRTTRYYDTVNELFEKASR